MFTKLSKRAVSLVAALAVFASVPAAIVRMNILAAAEAPQNAGHTIVNDEGNTDSGHDWSEDWTTSPEGHYHACVRAGEGCEGKNEAGAHIWGVGTGQCTTCNYECKHEGGYDSSNGKCNTCGKECTHVFTDNGDNEICNTCKKSGSIIRDWICSRFSTIDTGLC